MNYRDDLAISSLHNITVVMREAMRPLSIREIASASWMNASPATRFRKVTSRRDGRVMETNELLLQLRREVRRTLNAYYVEGILDPCISSAHPHGGVEHFWVEEEEEASPEVPEAAQEVSEAVQEMVRSTLCDEFVGEPITRDTNRRILLRANELLSNFIGDNNGRT